MIKQTLYGKTKRLGIDKFYITEKLDGSNLGFFRLGDKLIVAQRNWILVYPDSLNKPDFDKGKLYPQLYDYLIDSGEDLLDNLHDGSGVFGEWMGQGSIKNYGDDIYLFNIFAKARIRLSSNGNYVVSDYVYSHDLLHYAFITEVLPINFRFVPLIDVVNVLPTIDYMNDLYDKYVDKVGRDVEGFVVSFLEIPRKYVRLKRGKLSEHYFRVDKDD